MISGSAVAGRGDPDASADSTAHPTAAGGLMAVGKTRLGEEHFFCRTLAVEVVHRYEEDKHLDDGDPVGEVGPVVAGVSAQFPFPV